MKKINKLLVYLPIIAIVTIGFLLRLKGISNNHSFWSDEAYIAAISKGFIQGIISFNKLIQLPAVNYQWFHIFITILSMKLLGFTEFAARIPSVIFSTIAIVITYLIGTKLSDKWGGVLSGSLFALAQINLAYATQAKSYAGLQLSVLTVMYLTVLLYNNPRRSQLIHKLIIFIAIIASLFHISGLLSWIIYLSYLLVEQRDEFKKLLTPSKLLIISILIIILFVILKPTQVLHLFSFTNGFFIKNDFSYLRELFWRNYAFITLPALFGLLIVASKYRGLVIGLSAYIGIILFAWTFVFQTHNIRYLTPIFGILFTFFGVFWAKVGERLMNKKSWVACSIVLILILVGGYKIIRKPAIYYTPNADFYGDIQIADYKKTFALIKQKYPDLSDVAFFTDWHEPSLWYLPTKKPTAYFIKGSFAIKPEPHNFDSVLIYGNLKQFLQQKAKYKKGILLVEDWESLLPEDIKQYAKKHMKRVIRVEGLPEAQGDNWPIEVYSWGMK